ncbi:MAG: hypothetical protein K6E92_00035 [Lachnospiraceae bacterium]|nr:hypothetical protein [Lachnospiraceae bacterium]
MILLEKLTKIGMEAGSRISAQTKRLRKIADLKAEIATCDEVIGKNYLKIGKAVCDARLSGTQPEEALLDKCTVAVKNARHGREELEKELRNI